MTPVMIHPIGLDPFPTPAAALAEFAAIDPARTATAKLLPLTMAAVAATVGLLETMAQNCNGYLTGKEVMMLLHLIPLPTPGTTLLLFAVALL